MATVGQDLFIEAVNTALSAHGGIQVGLGWNLEAAQFTVIGATDTLQHNTNAIHRARKADDIGADDMDVSASVAVAGATIRLAGVCARMSTDNYTNQYEAYLQFKTTTTQDVFLFKNVAGTRTQLGTAVVTLNQNTQATLKLAIRAGTQEVFINGVSRIATTEPDSTLSGRQYAGVVMNGNNSSNALLDNFLSESVSTAAALEGDATGTATGAGTLDTGIPLAAAVAGTATSASALTTAIPLLATAGGLATTTGALATAVQLGGAATGLTTATAGLATAIPLAAGATGLATTSAALTTGAAGLTGAATGLATATGALATGIPLAGSVTGAVTVTAALTMGTGLGATAFVSVTTAGALLTAVRLAGAATGAAASAGALTIPLPLVGSATTAATSTGALTTSIALAAPAIVVVTASGSLTSASPLEWVLADATPTDPYVGAYKIGNTYTLLVTGAIVGARFWRADAVIAGAGGELSHVLELWNAAGALEATSIMSTELAGYTGWVDVTFPTPIATTAGDQWTVTYQPSGFVQSEAAPLLTDATRATYVTGRYNVAGPGYPPFTAPVNYNVDLQWQAELHTVLTAAVLARAIAFGHLTTLASDEDYDAALWTAVTMRQPGAGLLTMRQASAGTLTMRQSSFGTVAVLDED